MQNIVVINNTEVHFSIKDSAVHTSSLEVAKVFEKRHGDVIRVVETMSARGRRNFALTSYIDNSNREQKMYEMNRDGFAFVVMGFTETK